MPTNEPLFHIYTGLVSPNNFGDSLTNIAKNRKKVVINCQEQAIDFDKFKKRVVKKIGLPESPKSCDALYLSKRDVVRWVLIEFKSGKIKNVKKNEIKEKVCDSLLLLTDELNVTLNFTREEFIFLFVYRPDENPQDFIEKHLSGKAEVPSIVSNLRRRLEKLYFKEVVAYTIQEFDREFNNRFIAAASVASDGAVVV
ncbi:hypothetical protein FACS189427_08830 [Planctomycetales bacterium]|nr:hypothetical protein FACS189427_08830 [Planctomycetales bacterium]